MKSFLKRISKKTVSVILALAVILSSVTVMMAVFAEPTAQSTEPYFVSDGSPAIPMFKDKVVDLSNVLIELADGSVIAATDATWEVASGTNVKKLGDKLWAMATGITEFTVTYNSVPKSIYVVVNDGTGENKYDFVIEQRDLTTSYVRSEEHTSELQSHC